MTLEAVINDFLNEKYSFFKYIDKDGNDIYVRLNFESHHEFFKQYMKYYREQPSLSDLLVDATQGIIKISQRDNNVYYIRHPHQEVFIDREGHQRGIPIEIANAVKENLLKYKDELYICETFSEIINIVEKCKVRGFGELAIYDTAVRIGAFLKIEPDRVYLHAGTREGIKALEEKGYLAKGSHKQKSLSITEMPKSMHKLSADEIQHFTCAKKEELHYLDYNNG